MLPGSAEEASTSRGMICAARSSSPSRAGIRATRVKGRGRAWAGRGGGGPGGPRDDLRGALLLPFAGGHPDDEGEGHGQRSCWTGLVRVPRPSTSTVTSSPSCSRTFGAREPPRPAGGPAARLRLGGVAPAADALALDVHRVAVLQQDLRVAEDADACGRARGDEVA